MDRASGILHGRDHDSNYRRNIYIQNRLESSYFPRKKKQVLGRCALLRTCFFSASASIRTGKQERRSGFSML
jgi:hypothetical protein